MPIKAKISFEKAAYNVAGYDEKNGREYVKYGNGADVLDGTKNFNANDVITIYVADWDYNGVITIVGGLAADKKDDVNKTMDVVEGATLYWPTFSRSAGLEAKVQAMIVEEIKKLLPADR